MRTLDEEKTYNGWRNRETWNVALWIGNDEGLYNLACDSRGSYRDFAMMLEELGSIQTRDGIAWRSPALDYERLDEMLDELRGIE